MLWTVQSKCPCAPFFPIALAAAERGLGFLDFITPFIILQSPLVCQVLLADLPATSGGLCHTRKQPGGEHAAGDRGPPHPIRDPVRPNRTNSVAVAMVQGPLMDN